MNKGALSFEKKGRVFIYSPLVMEEEYINQKSTSFLERYFHGDITAMVSSYLEHDNLTESDIEALRSLLAEQSKEGGK